MIEPITTIPIPPASPKELPAQPNPTDYTSRNVNDPDYARIFTQARCIAWSHGFSCCLQGNGTRDLDLLIVPWTDEASGYQVENIVKHIADVADLKIVGNTSGLRPHGRVSWTLLLPGFKEVRWVDISTFPSYPRPVPAPSTPEQA